MNTHSPIASWLIVTLTVLLLTVIIVLTEHRDQSITIKYSCTDLINSQYLDQVPIKVVDDCRKKGYKYDNSKTSY